MSAAIRVDGLGKKFDIGVQRQKTVGQQLRYWMRGQQPVRTFWALRDISFEVDHGDGLGVIGPNGSGKSTLLRILAGIMQPNEGRVERDGRLNPFLALGVGLLPQLTVMENLRLCAALLGYTGREFKTKLDQIIAFSELEDYLYAAVHDLSAGWASRVAFSIAVHTDLNILLVDETMEVGDAYFQKKCKTRFEEIKKEGKTIVLVSHSIGSLLEMCNKAIYLDSGRQALFGSVKDVAARYRADIDERSQKIH